jgi:aryl-alcohol dehydrogenase-like predicted oxidoreductase
MCLIHPLWRDDVDQAVQSSDLMNGALMRYRKLGSSDLEVSEISLGSWLTYAGGVEAEQTRACTEAAFAAGINLFDTANVYGRGAAETAWGEILSAHPRESYILATKVWGQMSDDPTDRGLSATQIAKQIDASLERLQVDYVDLYQAHRFDVDVAIEETIAALQQVVRDGKARYLGFSEWTPEQIEAAIDIAGPDLFVSSQPQYSMLWQALLSGASFRDVVVTVVRHEGWATK